MNNLINIPENFKGGKIREFYENWKCITSDKWILNTVLGYDIEFDTFPQQNRPKPVLRFSDAEAQLITEEICKLEKKNVIEKVNRCENDFISNILLRPKKDGSGLLVNDHDIWWQPSK
jgi:hypothetical protein